VEDQNDKNNFYSTCYNVLVTVAKLSAPVTPFISEEIFRNLTGKESVHLEQWPQIDESLIDLKLENEMQLGQELASAINAVRKQKGIKVKIPFKKLSYKGLHEISEEVADVVKAEGNVYSLEFVGKKDSYSIPSIGGEENLDKKAGEARDIIRSIQQKRKEMGTTLSQMVKVSLPSWPVEFEAEIKRKALVSELIKAENFEVTAQ
jgi:isoleucyl-tRNA synthetase